MDKTPHHLPQNLKDLVKESVAVLGEVLRLHLGQEEFERIESLRKSMASLRTEKVEVDNVLEKELDKLKGLSKKQRRDTAHAFSLMLELINACENAYRSHRLQERPKKVLANKPDALIYVLTAHPTEARHPKNLILFQRILKTLEKALVSGLSVENKEELFYLLDLAWKSPLTRNTKPTVLDEAELLYHLLFRDEAFLEILNFSREIPVFVRTWVGGDKDGHDGVNENIFLKSLSLSRRKILSKIKEALDETSKELYLEKPLKKNIDLLIKDLSSMGDVKSNDGKKVLTLKEKLKALASEYKEIKGYLNPALTRLKSLVKMFPALVVPLEFREDSGKIKDEGSESTIYKMLRALSAISLGLDPKFYVRALIVSMTQSSQDLLNAYELIERAIEKDAVPVVPLFEQNRDLMESPKILEEFFKVVKPPSQEIMLGYSDSAKEGGVLRSRLQVPETMEAIEKVCEAFGVVPVFFHGSGGSTDRGGGPVLEQLRSWSKMALKTYKVTLQGEMVERSLANSSITRGQLQNISEGIDEALPKVESLVIPEAMKCYADEVSRIYKNKVQDPAFLDMISLCTPYPFLDRLKMGSRPSKRQKKATLKSLRAIPWILCWTQTRVLFPTWFGAGWGWENMTSFQKQVILENVTKVPSFLTYLHALDYTLEKVELEVWDLYLRKLPKKDYEAFSKEFREELERTKRMVKELKIKAHLQDQRPWLKESIHLRSPMIHPLNLLQLIAMETRDYELLRTSVAGISLGMLTTG